MGTFEGSMGSAMQELVVREAASSFRESFPADASLQDKAFNAAVKRLSGQELSTADDPVSAHFDKAFSSLQGVDLSKIKGNAKGNLAERVAFAQQAKDVEFQQTFMVTAAEAAEVQALASKAKSGDGFDFSKLAPEAADRLDALYASINGKVGFAMPNLVTNPITLTSDSAANSYIEKVNAQLVTASTQLREARLKAFVGAF